MISVMVKLLQRKGYYVTTKDQLLVMREDHLRMRPCAHFVVMFRDFTVQHYRIEGPALPVSFARTSYLLLHCCEES